MKLNSNLSIAMKIIIKHKIKPTPLKLKWIKKHNVPLFRAFALQIKRIIYIGIERAACVDVILKVMTTMGAYNF